jgi:hypothetical protein
MIETGRYVRLGLCQTNAALGCFESALRGCHVGPVTQRALAQFGQGQRNRRIAEITDHGEDVIRKIPRRCAGPGYRGK